jgi:hypothetical protein
MRATARSASSHTTRASRHHVSLRGGLFVGAEGVPGRSVLPAARDWLGGWWPERAAARSGGGGRRTPYPAGRSCARGRSRRRATPGRRALLDRRVRPFIGIGTKGSNAHDPARPGARRVRPFIGISNKGRTHPVRAVAAPCLASGPSGADGQRSKPTPPLTSPTKPRRSCAAGGAGRQKGPGPPGETQLHPDKPNWNGAGRRSATTSTDACSSLP